MRVFSIGLLGLVVVVVVAVLFFTRIRNPQIIQEIRDEPRGERARKVMLLTLPSGRVIPVNYLREGNRVYAGADFGWWKEIGGEGRRVEVQVFGEKHAGLARAVLDDPGYTRDVFSRLRPSALPGFGKLIEIRLDPDDPGGSTEPGGTVD